MRKLRLFEHISLDGVIQHSDDGDGFAYGNWTAPFRNPSGPGAGAVLAAQGSHFDLLLGRRTYDLWSQFWPSAPGGPMADALNAATKYVVTHRPDSLAWGPFAAVGLDLADDIRRVKSAGDKDLVLWGSSTLTSALLAHDLVDELVLVVYPVLLGTGKRLFADGTPPRSLALVSTQPFASGIVFNTYSLAGPLKPA